MFNAVREAAKVAANEAIDKLWKGRLDVSHGQRDALDWTLAVIQVVQALNTRVAELEYELD